VCGDFRFILDTNCIKIKINGYVFLILTHCGPVIFFSFFYHSSLIRSEVPFTIRRKAPCIV
jgi:hypothetical protein